MKTYLLAFRSWRFYPGVCLAVVYVWLTLNNFEAPAGCLAIFGGFFLLSSSSHKGLTTQQITNFIFLGSAFLVSFQFLGEIFNPVFRPSIVLPIALALACLVRLILNIIRTPRTSSLNLKSTLSYSSLGIALWVALLQGSNRTALKFLGFGYDNAAHLQQIKMILAENGTTYLAGDSKFAPSFLQDVSQAPGAFVAALANLFGVNVLDNSSLLKVFSLVTLTLPCIAVFSFYKMLRSRSENLWAPLIYASLFFLFISIAYPSHIWFSGYLGSNLGTVFLLLIVIDLASTPEPDSLRVTSLGIIVGHFYPIYLIICLAFLVPVWAKSAIQLWRHRNYSSLRSRRLMVTFLLGISLWFPYQATHRSYGSGQFLTPGGVSEIPSLAFMFLGTVALVAIFACSRNRANNWILLFSLLLCLLLGVLVTWYSIAKTGSLAYYPTKILITILLITVAGLFSACSDLSVPRINALFAPVLSVLITLTFLLLSPAPKYFVSGFMGKPIKVFESLFRPSDEMVNVALVLTMSQVSIANNLPVLYYSSQYESELNSRWINTLSNRWTDITWGAWMLTREQINKGLESLPPLKELDSIILATDIHDVLLYLSRSNFSIVSCFVANDVSVDCRESTEWRDGR